MTKSKIFFFFCLSFIIGIFIGLIIKISLPILLAFFIFGLILVSVFFRKIKIVIFGFCLIFLTFGVWKSDLAFQRIVNNGFVKNELYNKRILLEGTVLKEPDIREKIIQLTVGDLYLIKDGRKISLNEKILVTARRYPEYQYGQRIKIFGKIEIPLKYEDFNYKNYLFKDGIFAVMAFPKIELLESDKKRFSFWPFVYSGVLFFKNKIRKSIKNNFSPPQSSILQGMILGENSAMSQELKEKINNSGLRHIIAISGSHIVIISSILMSFFLMLGFWRSQAFYFTIIFVIFYIIMAGLPASGVRAGIMGGIFLLAEKLGRQNISSRTIIIACAFMLFLNPLLLLYDVGFQLSFLASMGLIYLSPLISEGLNFFTGQKGKNIKDIIAMTASAQIFTLPILIYNFSNFSWLSLIANLLVLPAVYLIMIFGFASAFLGLISGFLAWLFSFPASFLLFYFLKVIDLFSWKFMFRIIANLHWIWLVFFYLILGLFVFYLNKRQKPAFKY